MEDLNAQGDLQIWMGKDQVGSPRLSVQVPPVGVCRYWKLRERELWWLLLQKGFTVCLHRCTARDKIKPIRGRMVFFISFSFW